MSADAPIHIRTISEYHQLMELGKPIHPLISVVRFEDTWHTSHKEAVSILLSHYTIALKRNFRGKMKYGQQSYDFDEGIMTFMAPGQVLRIEWAPEPPVAHTGWMLIIHPDFLSQTTLATKIKRYDFFNYNVHEALFLSEKEEIVVVGLMEQIATEYSANLDPFTHNIILSQLELLLNYAERFYNRQFLTRRISSHHLLERIEEELNKSLTDECIADKGMPTVNDLAKSLNVSPGYLGNMLRLYTGKSTTQHIQDKLVTKAKEKLAIKDLSISEIAYILGFGHPQSFSKWFKAKTKWSPLAFRTSIYN